MIFGGKKILKYPIKHLSGSHALRGQASLNTFWRFSGPNFRKQNAQSGNPQIENKSRNFSGVGIIFLSIVQGQKRRKIALYILFVLHIFGSLLSFSCTCLLSRSIDTRRTRSFIDKQGTKKRS